MCNKDQIQTFSDLSQVLETDDIFSLWQISAGDLNDLCTFCTNVPHDCCPQKKLKGELLTKTEKEYFSRTVKKKVAALANPDLHRLAQKLMEY